MVWIMNLLFWSILSNTYCRFFAITILASSSIWFSTARLYRWMFNENATYQYDSLHWMSIMKKIFLSVSVLLSDWIVCEHWISNPQAYCILNIALCKLTMLRTYRYAFISFRFILIQWRHNEYRKNKWNRFSCYVNKQLKNMDYCERKLVCMFMYSNHC